MIVTRHNPILGTLVEIALETDDRRLARDVDDDVVAEFDRWERILSIHDPHSEISRWKRREVDGCSPDLRRVLLEAIDWAERSDGAYTLSSGVVADLHRRTGLSGRVPTSEEYEWARHEMEQPILRIDDGEPVRLGNVTGLDLNAFAKGWIVDRAVERATARADIGITINAGGDLRRVSTDPLIVDLENPRRPYDNEPPVARISLTSGGLATTGLGRRSVLVGDELVSHIVDPRTGRPSRRHGSVTIVGPDAATADVLATICYLDDTAIALRRATDLGCGCVIVDLDGHISHNDLVVLT